MEEHYSSQAERTEREISGGRCFGYGRDNFDVAVVAQANLPAGAAQPGVKLASGSN
jgi:hypothetical protein